MDFIAEEVPGFAKAAWKAGGMGALEPRAARCFFQQIHLDLELERDLVGWFCYILLVVVDVVA